jgi:N-acetylglucosamine-6-phosphate deacetylase
VSDLVASGRLVVGDAILAGRLVAAEGRIVSIEPDPAAADGPYVVPGFVDLHVHGWGGHDAMGGPAALDGMARALLRRGVTSFLPTAVAAGLEALARFADGVRGWAPGAPPDGAVPLGFDLEGPFLAPSRHGAHDPALLREPASVGEAELAPLLEGLRVITIAPELPGALELIRRLAGRGVVVSLGHSEATLDEARVGYAAGARSTTHLFNAMSGVDHRRPGLAVAALADDAVAVELIADGHHVHPGLWPLVVRAKPADRLVLVSDALAAAGTVPEGGVGSTTIGGLAVEIRGGRATLAGTGGAGGGTLAGSLIALDDAVRNLVGAGIPLPRAVAAASTTPAGLVGAGDRGRLAVGMLAHLVELDDGLRVRRVTLGERWLDAAG